MTLPSYVLAGVPKAGTTSLYHYLDAHPAVAVSPLEEVNFLSYPGREEALATVPWLRFPVTTLDRYQALFRDAGDRVAVDFSASCFGSAVSIERIRRYVPGARLLVLLRNPVDRAYSAYLHRVRKGYERRPADEALVPGERTVDLGFYSRRLQEFRDAFGGERVRVWTLDDLRLRPQETLVDMFGYLGVDPSVSVDADAAFNRASVPRVQVLHRALPDHALRRRLVHGLPTAALRPARWLWARNQADPPPLAPEIRHRLGLLYEEDILRLERILDRDLGAWRGLD